MIQQVVNKTLHEKPAAATHWRARKLAKAVGLSHTSVQRIWKAQGLKPHLMKTFKLSNDKRFVEKVKDIVGLYLDPPDKALVFSVDEKSQIQALDRTQPGLPMKKGRAGTMTHDYKRHGTTTLFAALDVATGKVIGQCMKRHRHQEWLKFLRPIDRKTQKKLDLHLIADNYATHKHAKVKAWLKRHPRFHMHFTPTSASWLNQVERFFGLITEDRIRRGVFKSVAELETAIQQYLDHHNADPKPSVLDRFSPCHPRKGRPRATSVKVGTLAERIEGRDRNLPTENQSATEYVEQLRTIATEAKNLPDNEAAIRAIAGKVLSILSRLLDTLGTNEGAQILIAGAVTWIPGAGGWPSAIIFGLSLAVWQGKEAFLAALGQIPKTSGKKTSKRPQKILSLYRRAEEIRDRMQNHALQDVSSKNYDRWTYMPKKRAGMEKERVRDQAAQ